MDIDEETVAKFAYGHEITYSHTPIGSSWTCSCGAGDRRDYDMPKPIVILMAKNHLNTAAIASLIRRL